MKREYKPTEPQLRALRWAKDKYSDGRVPPWVFSNGRSILALLDAGFIDYWADFGAPMYKITDKGLAYLWVNPSKGLGGLK